MKSNALKIVFLFVCFFSFYTIRAQDTLSVDTTSTDYFSLTTSVVSRYVWRGLALGNQPTIQPGIDYTNKGFSVGAWGAFANHPGNQEVDLYLGYTFKEKYSLLLTDYFFPNEMADYNYFNYDENSTGHLLELTLKYVGDKKFPVTVLFASNIWGADAKRINTDGTIKGNQHSSYLELGYAFNNIDFFIGTELTDPDETRGETGFYGNTVGVINLGVTKQKDIQITDKFSLPLVISLITNPQAEKIYMVAGFSF